jgi:periplasmic protein CpxP/Spy
MQTTDSLAHQPLFTGQALSILPFLLASVALCTLPQIASAQPPASPHGCERISGPHLQGEAPPAFMAIPMLPPYLSGIELTEAQQDTLFMLMRDNATAIFENEKIARKTMQELHQLAGSGHFDIAKSRSLADAHGKALAELTYLHTIVQAQTWAMLSAKQRMQISAHSEHPAKK